MIKISLLVVHLLKLKRSSAFRGGATRLFPLWSWNLLHTHGPYQRKTKATTFFDLLHINGGQTTFCKWQDFVQVYGIPGYGRWANQTDPDIGPEHGVILGWNEPNQADQADIPPDVAALAWIEHQEKYADKVFCKDILLHLSLSYPQILVAPAMGHADTEWFDAFYGACEQLGCRLKNLGRLWFEI